MVVWVKRWRNNPISSSFSMISTIPNTWDGPARERELKPPTLTG